MKSAQCRPNCRPVFLSLTAKLSDGQLAVQQKCLHQRCSRGKYQHNPREACISKDLVDVCPKLRASRLKEEVRCNKKNVRQSRSLSCQRPNHFLSPGTSPSSSIRWQVTALLPRIDVTVLSCVITNCRTHVTGL